MIRKQWEGRGYCEEEEGVRQRGIMEGSGAKEN